ncbi:MAG: cation-translocating P-type ATPase [Cryomorphaceae bacterium]
MENRLNLKVQGMTCNHCASTVGGIIQQEGGKDIHVDYLMGEADFDLSQADRLQKILSRLKSAGYEAKSEASEEAATSGFSSIEKKFLFTLPFSLVLFSHMFVPHDWWINDPWVQFLLCLPVYSLGAYHFGKSTIEAIKSGNINMDLLILLGSTSAFGYSLYGAIEYGSTAEAHDFLFFETTSTIISLVLLGYVIEHRAVQKTTTLLRDLIKSKPEKAKKLVQKGLNQDLEVVLAVSLRPKDLILINAGDRVPADGIIVHGDLTFNEAMLTGEAEGIRKGKGREIFSGSLVTEGNGTVEVTKAGDESTIGKIIELVKQSRSDKPSVQKLADKISSWFVPTIVALAVLTFCINAIVIDTPFSDALLRSIAVLVIACPCAMGLATPTAVSVGLGVAARIGIIVKKASAFEEVSALSNVVFDKTGTLTTGDLDIILEDTFGNFTLEEIWGMIRTMEKRSNHPIALKILSLTEGMDEVTLENIQEVTGGGLQAGWKGKRVKFGTPEFCGITEREVDLVLTVDDEIAAKLSVSDRLKSDAQSAISFLRSQGLDLSILSGDSASKTKSTADALGISDFHFRQLPEQKLKMIAELKTKGKVGMVGDGINDSPSLAKADVGISMGSANALAAESAKIVILGDKLNNLERLFRVSNKVVTTIKQNLFWAFSYNLIAIPLAASGYLDPMVAALSMAFSDVVVIGNSLRLRYVLGKHSV